MLEEKIKNLIIEKYGSVRQFAIKIDIPYTTIDSILKRGIDNSNVNNVIKMCKALNISIDKSLEKNDIISSIYIDDNVSTEYELADEYEQPKTELEILFSKAKDKLSDDDFETMKFLMEKTIRNYEESKKNQ